MFRVLGAGSRALGFQGSGFGYRVQGIAFVPEWPLLWIHTV